MANPLTEKLAINRVFGTSPHRLYHVDSLVFQKQSMEIRHEAVIVADRTHYNYAYI